ncbi:MAG TPA: Hsp20/alpha crystallin family protein [Aequorivita sp.]|nr:Hsp20/alpha crystallin family protein [Aequorivita sp.]
MNKENLWLPAILEDMFFDNKIDVPNKFKTFSIPAVNISENLINFAVELAAPGLKKEDFSIEIDEETLTVSVKQASEAEEKEENNDSRYQRREFNYREFKRSFKMPENVKSEDVKATYTDGILKITLPKKEEEKALKRMVEIS